MTERDPERALDLGGVAGLRGAPVSVRYERMLAIAHPEHRTALAAALEEQLMNGALR